MDDIERVHGVEDIMRLIPGTIADNSFSRIKDQYAIFT